MLVLKVVYGVKVWFFCWNLRWVWFICWMIRIVGLWIVIWVMVRFVGLNWMVLVCVICWFWMKMCLVVIIFGCCVLRCNFCWVCLRNMVLRVVCLLILGWFGVWMIILGFCIFLWMMVCMFVFWLGFWCFGLCLLVFCVLILLRCWRKKIMMKSSFLIWLFWCSFDVWGGCDFCLCVGCDGWCVVCVGVGYVVVFW